MKILVTGATGFIGGYVLNRLKSDGQEVIAFDRSEHPITHLQVDRFLGDIRDRNAVAEAVAHADGVIHLAGILGTAETIDNPYPAADTNIFGGLNMLEAVTSYKVPLVVITVGNYWENNTYSISKSTIERFAAMYRQYRGTQVSVVRALNAWGPGQSVAAPYGASKVRKVIPSFVCRALSGDPIQVYSDPEKGSSIMDMIHVADVAAVLVNTLYKTINDGPLDYVVEAGTGRRTTVDDIANMVVAAVGQGEIEHLPMRRGETPGAVVVGNTDTLKGIVSLLGLISLEEGLPDTVAYYEDYLDNR